LTANCNNTKHGVSESAMSVGCGGSAWGRARVASAVYLKSIGHALQFQGPFLHHLTPAPPATSCRAGGVASPFRRPSGRASSFCTGAPLLPLPSTPTSPSSASRYCATACTDRTDGPPGRASRAGLLAPGTQPAAPPRQRACATAASRSSTLISRWTILS
jgi:hypothetical protein